jgi:hypothetical protein
VILPTSLLSVPGLLGRVIAGGYCMAGKTAVKKEKAKPQLTKRACAKCGERMMSDKIQTVLVVDLAGGRSRNYLHRHKGCE